MSVCYVLSFSLQAICILLPSYNCCRLEARTNTAAFALMSQPWHFSAKGVLELEQEAASPNENSSLYTDTMYIQDFGYHLLL